MKTDKLLADINKQFGEGTAYRASDMPPIEVISTGSLSLDFAIGIGGIPRNRVVEIVGEEGSGKLLALDTPIPTPQGWTDMGKLVVGDQVFDEQGRPSTVLGVFDGNPSTSYDVTFNDGSVIRACGEHLWTTWTNANRTHWGKRDTTGRFPEDWPAYSYTNPRTDRVTQQIKTLTTEQIRDTLVVHRGSSAKNNHGIPVTAPLQLPDADLPIHPWVLGYWLGNGDVSGGRITCSVTDEAEVKDRIRECGFEVSEVRAVGATGGGVAFTVFGLGVLLRENLLLGHKHIPNAYLRASEPQRIALAAGLLDSDGHQDELGHVEFAQKSRALIEQASELLVSLSQKPVLRAKEAFIGAQSYGVHHRLYFNPTRDLFTLTRKAERFRPDGSGQTLRRHHRVIVGVTRVENEPMRCIMVDSPNRLYLAGRSMIPTHNSSAALLIARQFIDVQPDRAVIVLDMEHKMTPDWVDALIGSERMDNLLILSPDTIEQATDMYRSTVMTGKVSMIILDSIGGAPTARVMDEDRSANKGEVAGNAAGVTKFARFAANFSVKYDLLTLGINQVRDDMEGYHRLVTPGGRGWKHACVLRIQLRRGKEKYFEKINGEEIQVGYDVIARCFKNHLATEGRIAQWRFFNRPCKLAPLGVDTTEECVRLAMLVGVIERAGAYYRHHALPGGQLQGKDKLLDLILSDQALRLVVTNEVMAVLRSDPTKLGEVAPVTDIDESMDLTGDA